MTDQTVIDIGVRTIWVTMKVAAPALLASLVAGIIISVLQAATQIHEQTLSFLPKILVMTLALVVTGPWILQTMIDFTVEIFRDIPMLVH